MPALDWTSPGSYEAQFMRLLVDHVSDCLIAVDTAGRVILVNRPYCELLGGSEEEFLGRPITEVVGPQTRLHLVAQGAGELTAYPLEVRGQKLLARQVPIVEEGRTIGAVGLALFSNAGALKRAYTRMQGSLAVTRPSRAWRARHTLEHIVGTDPQVEACRKAIRQAAAHDLPVLVTGETGTGKELAAQAVHNLSDRASGPFVWINCASIPAELIDSELFGYEPGAFTGAQNRGKPGKFELASDGTLFLDEIGDMPLPLQGSLLRALQSGEIVRVGGTTPCEVNVRIVCATHRPLEDLVRSGKFRADLYYRLAVFPLHMPPLRLRDDKARLIDALLEQRNRSSGRRARPLSESDLTRLLSHDWPGNVRELESVLARYHLTGEISLFARPISAATKDAAAEASASLKGIVRDRQEGAVRQAIAEAGGNRTRAAARLGISRAQLYRILDGPRQESDHEPA